MPAAPGPSANPSPGDRNPQLVEAVYQQLRAIAQQRMQEENTGHTLQATALVHEVFLRIGQDRRIPFENEAHFYAAAAEAMRRVLIDHARVRSTDKRGGSFKRAPLSVVDLAEATDPTQVLALDDALSRLEQEEPETAAVVRLRFFAGLSGDQTAAALGISPRQVDRVWAYARAWLARELEKVD